MKLHPSTLAAWCAVAVATTAAAWFFLAASRQQEEIQALRKELDATRSLAAATDGAPILPAAPFPEPGLRPPVEFPRLNPAETVTNQGIAMTTYAAGSNAPSQPPEMPEAVVQAMASFDRAMDKEFDRLESLEKSTLAEAEQDLIEQLKEQMLLLDDIHVRADEAETDEEIAALQIEMQSAMGRIISLGHSHRRQRLEEMAKQAGYQTDEDVRAFLKEIDGIYRETQLDWAALFNRGP